MSLESALYTRLSTYAGLTALVADRIEPLVIPQNSPVPVVTYQVFARRGFSAFGDDISDVRKRVQIDSWDDDHFGAKAVADQVKAALKRHTGTHDGTVIDDVYLETEMDRHESEGAPRYRVMQDYEIAYQEA